jgi:putative ABC transport system substrate-binding protein
MGILALGLLAGLLAADAQPAGKVARVTFLRAGPPPKAFVEAFQEGLRESGYVEGRDLVVDYRFPDGTTGRLSDLAREVVKSKPDAILASAAPAALAARDATTTIPIVFAAAVDPVESGLAASLAQPGGNVTGMSILSADLLGKRLGLLKELLPKLARVALLWNPTNPTHAPQLKAAEGLTPALGIQLQPLAAGTPEEFERALAIARAAQALLQLDDVLFTTHRERLAALATKSRLPVMYGHREMVEAGGLMSFGANLPDLYRRAAAYVEKVLKGARPQDLPIQQPTKFELVINLKTAKALDLTFPQSVLLRADDVID